MDRTMTITYLNRQGGGFAERIDVNEGTTVGQFIQGRGISADDYTIRIIRDGCGAFTPTAVEILQEGDRLSCVPLKIAGASCK